MRNMTYVIKCPIQPVQMRSRISDLVDCCPARSSTCTRHQASPEIAFAHCDSELSVCFIHIKFCCQDEPTMNSGMRKGIASVPLRS